MTTATQPGYRQQPRPAWPASGPTMEDIPFDLRAIRPQIYLNNR